MSLIDKENCTVLTSTYKNDNYVIVYCIASFPNFDKVLTDHKGNKTNSENFRNYFFQIKKFI